jgi:hypothetical protein
MVKPSSKSDETRCHKDEESEFQCSLTAINVLLFFACPNMTRISQKTYFILAKEHKF